MSESAVDSKIPTSKPDMIKAPTAAKVIDSAPLPTPTVYVNQQLIDQLKKMRQADTQQSGDTIPRSNNAQLRRNNLAILSKSIIRHLTSFEDIKKHLGSPSRIKNTLQKDVWPRVKSIVSPELKSRSGLIVNTEQRLGMDYVELKAHTEEKPVASLTMLPPGVRFDYRFVDQTKIPKPKWTRIFDQMRSEGKKMICAKPGSTYDRKSIGRGRQARIPSFGMVMETDGEIKEVVPFKDHEPQDQIQHGGFILTKDNLIEIIDFPTLKQTFEDIKNRKVNPNIKAAYQGDWFADEASFGKIENRPNMQQSNNFNVVGQFKLSDGTSRYFVASTDLTPLSTLFELVERSKKLTPKVVDTKIVGLEFLGGDACFLRKNDKGQDELFYIDVPEAPLGYEMSDLINSKPDFLIAFMPHGL